MGCKVNAGALDKVLIRNILEHALAYPWKIQDIGLLALRLDEQREYALHVWAPDRCTGTPPIHDHPYDFVARIIVGEVTNARYVEDSSGVKYLRERYTPSNEEARTTDYVQLVSEVETFKEGDAYAQVADELHDSHRDAGRSHRHHTPGTDLVLVTRRLHHRHRADTSAP